MYSVNASESLFSEFLIPIYHQPRPQGKALGTRLIYHALNNNKPGVTNSYFLFRFIHFSFKIFLRQCCCVGVNKKLFMLVNSQLVSLRASSTGALSRPPAPVPLGILASYQLVNYCSLRVKRRYGWRIREKETGTGERGKGTISGFSTSPLVF